MGYSDRQKRLAYARQWTAKKEARWRAHGCCISCGLPSGVNPHTGKPFSRCFKHRLIQTARQVAYKRRKAAERIAA